MMNEKVIFLIIQLQKITFSETKLEMSGVQQTMPLRCSCA